MKSGYKMRLLSGAMVLAMGVMLSGCNDGGGDATTSTTTSTILSGTAAGGAAIIGSVTVKDRNGVEKSGLIDSNGRYEIDVSGMAAPFVLRADGKVGNTRVTYYSAATTAGNINITQFTDLIVANVANQLAESFFANFSTEAGKLTGDALATAQKALQDKLQPILSELGLDASIDLLRASFSTDHTGLDAALDLVRIDYTGNIASLTNTLNNALLGTDNVTTNTDDSVALDSTAVAALTTVAKTAVTAATEIDKWFKDFAALFATALPSKDQLSASGLFDTSSYFLDMGQSYDQLAREILSEGDLVGVTITNSAITFTNPEQTQARVRVQFKFKGGMTETSDLQLEKQNGVWKFVGDQRIADIEFNALAVSRINGSGSSMFSGLHLWLVAGDYNYRANSDANDNLDPVAYAVVTGPGLPTNGVTMSQQNQNRYFTVDGNNFGNQVPHCGFVSASAACVTIAETVDNGEYTVKLYKAGDIVMNGSGYTVKLASLKPLATSALTPAMFPTITSLKVNGIDFSSFNQFNSNTTLGVAWTLPAGMRGDYLFAWGSANGVQVGFGEDLTATQTSASLALGDTTGATSAGLYLSLFDPDDRMFAIAKEI